MSSSYASREIAAGEFAADKEAHLTALILQKRDAEKRIEFLQAEVSDLRVKLQQAAASQALWDADNATQPSHSKERTAAQNARMTEISTWNEELIRTVEKLQNALICLEADSKAQVVTLTDKVNQLHEENERLLTENDSLKSRVGDDVLRQRQTNRIEMAFERARIAARVRAAGLQRLEAAEASLMEAHDDIYHVQRWDALFLPQRDVSFVFHNVSGIQFPLNGVEEFIVSVYQQFLFHSSSCCHGYRVGFYKGMDVFAFQSPSDALLFAKESHEQLVGLSWPSRAESVPYFASIIESNTVLFKGPRIHTCIYACSPESYVDPVSGKYSFFGPEVLEAAQAAIEQAPIGEIAVNEKWAQLICKQSRMREDREIPAQGDTADLRESLGPQWDVVSLPGAHHIVASLLPVQLKSRRGVQPNVLHPSRKYPSLELKDSIEDARMIVKAMKGALSQTVERPEDAGKGINGGGLIMQQMRRRASVLQKAVLKSPEQMVGTEKKVEFSESAAQLLELFSLQQEKQNVIMLYRRTEKAFAALERDMMESEDRFEISKHKTLDASETAYVCTIDTGDDDIWKRILLKSISDEQFESIRSTIRAHIHTAAKVHFGFLMNGNYSDVFTYVFREAEQALAFVAEIYIKVNRTGTKYAHTSLGKGRDIFLFRAGVACGPMSTIYRNLENGVLKCTGPAIRLSGTLCDLAESGEILAMEDVIRTFYSKNENLLDSQYNIVKQGAQFVGSSDAPAVVHSILPKPFAYRRPQLRISGRGPMQREKIHLPYRSALAALMLHQDELPRQSVLDMMQQQQQRLEHAEAARMNAEDEYDQHCEVGSGNAAPLRNPWLLLCQPQAEEQTGNASATRRTLVRFKTTEELEADLMHATRPTATLAFLYIDVANLNTITRSVKPALLKRVWEHYNYIVQSCLRSYYGYVAKTNSVTAYLVVFEDAGIALEAARQIQLELVQTFWPAELKPNEATLQVKDPKTNTVLFNGPRAQMAVHVSNQYTWRPLLSSGGSNKSDSCAGASDSSTTNFVGSDLSAVHISGVGVDEAFILGRHAHGGEIRLSRPLLEAVGKHPSGKLLLEQLSMEVVVAPSVIRPAEDAAATRVSSAEGATTEKADKSKVVQTNMFSEECVASVPRRLHGRLALMLPPGTSEGSASVFKPAEEVSPPANSGNIAGNRGGSNAITRTSSLAPNTKGRTKSGQAAVDVPEEQVIQSIATGGTSSAVGKASSALSKATPLISTVSPQNSWIKDPRESSNPLPTASATNWCSDEEQASACLIAASVYNEAKQFQKVMQSVLKLFPSMRRRSLSLSLDRVSEGSVSELPTLASITTPLALVSEGDGGDGDESCGTRADGRFPKPFPDLRTGTQHRRSSKEESAGLAASKLGASGKRSTAGTAAARRTGASNSAIGQYTRFLDFSRYIISMLVNALEIGTDQRTPPQLPLPASGAGDEATGSRSWASQGAGSNGSSKDGRGGSTLPSGRSKNAQNSGLPLPPVPNAPGRLGGKAVGIAPSSAGSNQQSVNSKAADASTKGFTVNREKPFQSALDYIDDACRSLIQPSGPDVSRLAAIPAAPPSKPKPFSARPNTRRH
ncbi:hypothetical protein ABB37_03311 [Leptomonas pyrrhocoris]|uniref:Adenylyl cyclase n=1 Tax=Leptomonas pyrrhocoris TaxID=157538 RepID=A0A0M9G4W9_LEPPY|nr:hypothetical protein ABB37_03311 [Leptomonas pyrrhocoris]KPA82189.1 hypothetical protein ABB37_03311 [Leptomonas pyrrhocoris]|eukprot:XP_015660628.1 hypothetical protein ABB37_03311 [Leptomonas pyrrhocoris]